MTNSKQRWPNSAAHNSRCSARRGRGLVTVADRGDLEDLDPVANETALLVETGRDGVFYRQSGSPPVTDTEQGAYVVSDTAPYYWKRTGLTGVANAQRLGAAGDGSTDDSGAIIAAMTAGFRNIYLPSRKPDGSGSAIYRLSSQIPLLVDVAIFLDDCRTDISLPASMSASLFDIRAGGRQALAGTAARHGISVTGGGPVNIAGGILYSNTGRGLLTDGTTPVVMASGLTFNANGAGNYSLTGAFSHLAMSQLSSGALLTSATGTNG